MDASHAAVWAEVNRLTKLGVLVLVEPGADAGEVDQACSRVGDETNQTIDATVLTAREWESDQSSFARDVRARVTSALPRALVHDFAA